ncbi:hypothetical protein FNV43_RR16028 [Rhamnella rubrinervis]|nr:hypothetical protein FNV43_RR16028 [Rhamnella rubrinervis]
MAKDRNGAPPEKSGYDSEKEEENGGRSGKARESSCSVIDEDGRRSKSRRKARESSDSEDREEISHGKGRRRRRRRTRRRYSSEEDSSSFSESESSDSEGSGSDSESDSNSSGSEDSETERRRRRKRKERRRRKEKEEERERKRRKREKEKKRRRREKEEERKKERKKKEKKEKGKKGAVTNLWGKYGIIRETDMWTKRPEFTAWLAEVKQVNLESLPNWEEKQMFKQFMEDHNTATFPSKKYYNLDAYHQHKREKEIKRGLKVLEKERTVFNDEEQRRQELAVAREKQKEEEVKALKRSMQSGMAQAMKEQAQLREEMAYQYKVGNFEAAAAIQRRLDPDVAM